MGVVLSFAKSYTSFVETGAKGVYYSALGLASCAQSAIETVAASTNVGALKSGAEFFKRLCGFYELQKAWKVLHTKPPQSLPNGQTVVDLTRFSERAGESIGHLMNAAARFTAYGTGIVAFCVGTVSSKLKWRNGYRFGPFHSTSRSFAQASWGLIEWVTYTGLNAIQLTGEVAIACSKTLLRHPNKAFKVGGFVGGSYLACSQFIKGQESPSLVLKVYHYSLAILGLGIAFTAPTKAPFK